MKILPRIIVITVVLSTAPVVGNAMNNPMVPDSLVHRADSLFDAFEGKKALPLYQRILERDSTFYPSLWRISLLHSRIGFAVESEHNAKEHYRKALKWAKKALGECPACVESHFAMGVAMGRKALIASPRERVSASKEIKHHAEQALKADSSHAGAHHLYGRWHLEVVNLNLAERMAANWLFGGLPEGASIEQAIQHLKRATNLKSDFIIYWYDLGRAYHDKGDDQSAKHALKKALDLDPKLKSEDEYQEKARQLYRRLK